MDSLSNTSAVQNPSAQPHECPENLNKPGDSQIILTLETGDFDQNPEQEQIVTDSHATTSEAEFKLKTQEILQALCTSPEIQQLINKAIEKPFSPTSKDSVLKDLLQGLYSTALPNARTSKKRSRQDFESGAKPEESTISSKRLKPTNPQQARSLVRTTSINAKSRDKLLDLLKSITTKPDKRKSKDEMFNREAMLAGMDESLAPKLVWDFRHLNYAKHLEQIKIPELNKEDYFDPLMLTELLFFEDTDRELKDLIEGFAVKGLQTLLNAIQKVSALKACPKCAGNEHQGRGGHVLEECEKLKKATGYNLLAIGDNYICHLCCYMRRNVKNMRTHLASHHWMDLFPFGMSPNVLIRHESEEFQKRLLAKNSLPESQPEPDEHKTMRFVRLTINNPGYLANFFLKHEIQVVGKTPQRGFAMQNTAAVQTSLPEEQKEKERSQSSTVPGLTKILDVFRDIDKLRVSLDKLYSAAQITYNAVPFLIQVPKDYPFLFVGTHDFQVVLHYSNCFVSQIPGGKQQLYNSLLLAKKEAKRNPTFKATFEILQIRESPNAVELLLGQTVCERQLRLEPMFEYPLDHQAEKEDYRRLLKVVNQTFIRGVIDTYMALANTKICTTELWRPGQYVSVFSDSKTVRAMFCGYHTFYQTQDYKIYRQRKTLFGSSLEKNLFDYTLHNVYEDQYYQVLGALALMLMNLLVNNSKTFSDQSMRSQVTYTEWNQPQDIAEWFVNVLELRYVHDYEKESGPAKKLGAVREWQRATGGKENQEWSEVMSLRLERLKPILNDLIADMAQCYFGRQPNMSLKLMPAEKFKNSLDKWKALTQTTPKKILSLEHRSYEIERYQTLLVLGFQVRSMIGKGDHDCEPMKLEVVVEKERLGEKKPVAKTQIKKNKKKHSKK